MSTQPKAEQIDFTPSGGITSTNLQAALIELETNVNNEVSSVLAAATENAVTAATADAAASASEALGYLQTIRATSYGAYAEDPATDPLGNPPTVGDEYFNTTSNLLKRWNGTTWQASDINTANLAATSGSSLVGYDGGTVQDMLDSFKPMANYTSLRAYTGRATSIRITQIGLAGFFQLLAIGDPEYSAADDGGIIIVDASGRRWGRIFSGKVNVKWFGAKGDGSADDTPSIQKAIDYCTASIKKLFFPSGIYNITRTVWPTSTMCLYATGEISIEGEDRNATVIRTVKLDGTLPNGGGETDNTYRGAILFSQPVGGSTTAEVSIKNITFDGGNISAVRAAFNQYHKCVQFGNPSPATNYALFENVTIKNFEGEGAHAPNFRVNRTKFSSCLFTNNRGSSGNISGKTKYIDCDFVNCGSQSIEHALDPSTGYLVVDSCRFYNGCTNKAVAIAVQSVNEPFSEANYGSRTGTTFSVKNCTFTFEKTWIESFSTPYYFGSIGFKCVGTTAIENNIFKNACTGLDNGMAVIRNREWNDDVVIRGNVFTKTDNFFYTPIIPNGDYNNAKNNSIAIIDNKVSYEYPAGHGYLYPYPTTYSIGQFISARNVLNSGDVAFPSAINRLFAASLQVLKTYTVHIYMKVTVSAPTVVKVLDGYNTEIATLVNETLAIGNHTRVVTFTAIRANSDHFIWRYIFNGNSDSANTVSIAIVDA